jgi:hypothetical protein
VALTVADEQMRPTLPVVRIAARGVGSLVDALVPSDVALAEAMGLWSAFDRIERCAANAKTLLAARVEASGDWRRAGARSAAEHLAKSGGTSTGVARRSLETSKLLADLPAVVDAARGGVLSVAQVEAIAGAAAADPGAAERLVELAGTTSTAELRDECLRTRVAADPDRNATHARIHRERYHRIFRDAEGGWNVSARGTAEQGGRYAAALEPIIDELFNEARAEGRNEPREAYAFDAMILLAERANEPPADTKKSRRVNPRYLTLLHLDWEAMVRGDTEGDEKCEIVGIGPIPVRVARDLMGESILKLVVTKGVDVANVVHLGRGPTAAQRIALLWSKPKCANVECSSMFVQIDHREPWAATKHTVLGELDPLCPHDHKLKTNQGWSLVDGTGRRAFVGPKDLRHPRSRPPPDGG